MTGHLTRDQLRQWHDDGLGDRDAILAHLAECDACGTQYAAFVRESARPAEPPVLDPAAFRDAGYQAGPRRVRVRDAWKSWPAIAAAAALVLATAYIAERAADPARVVRGGQSTVRLVEPAGAVARADFVFRWDGPEGLYRLRVFDLASPDTPVITRDDVASGYRPTDDERAALREGVEYRWFVEQPGGDALTSPAARFTVR